MTRADRFAHGEPDPVGQRLDDGAPDSDEQTSARSASTAPIAEFFIELFGLATRWFGLKWELFALDAREQARQLLTSLLLLVLAGVFFLAGIVLLEIVALYLTTLALGSRLGAFFLLGMIQIIVGIALVLHVRKRVGEGK